MCEEPIIGVRESIDKSRIYLITENRKQFESDNYKFMTIN